MIVLLVVCQKLCIVFILGLQSFFYEHKLLDSAVLQITQERSTKHPKNVLQISCIQFA